VYDLENLVNEKAIARVGLQSHMKKNTVFTSESIRPILPPVLSFLSY
jgi:hypothetical protein